MSLTFTIKGWKTVPDGQCPCDTCDHAQRVKGKNLRQDRRHCHKLGETLPFEPTFCDGFAPKGAMPLYKLEQMAWNLLEDKRGALIGFRSPNKTRELVDEGKVARPDHVDPDLF